MIKAIMLMDSISALAVYSLDLCFMYIVCFAFVVHAVLYYSPVESVKLVTFYVFTKEPPLEKEGV